MSSFADRLDGSGPWWLGAAIVLLDLTAIARALVRGHGIASTIAWIFSIIAFPAIGAIAYLLLANPSVRRTIRRRTAASNLLSEAVSVDTPVMESERQTMRLAHELTGLPPTDSNAVEILMEDEKAFLQIERELENAQETIWAEYYIVRNDETGHRFLDMLAGKARAGVSIRLLYDAVGSMGLDGARLHAIRAAGGRVEPFLPLNPLRRRWGVHLRNHRKMIVIDSETVFTGGMNVGDEYSGRARLRGNQHFRDAHLRIRGPAVREFAAVFADDWAFATDEPLRLPVAQGSVAGGSLVSPLPSGPDQPLNASAHVFFAGIMAARRQCFVTTPYFIPDEPTVRALITSAKGGVDVRVLVPARNDVRLVGAASRSFHRELIRGGVRVFEYQPSMLHAKSMVVDDRWGIVGSANVDMRSFRLNFEVGAVVFDPRVALELSRRFLAELEASVEVTPATLKNVGVARRLGHGAARLLSPLL